MTSSSSSRPRIERGQRGGSSSLCLMDPLILQVMNHLLMMLRSSPLIRTAESTTGGVYCNPCYPFVDLYSTDFDVEPFPHAQGFFDAFATGSLIAVAYLPWTCLSSHVLFLWVHSIRCQRFFANSSIALHSGTLIDRDHFALNYKVKGCFEQTAYPFLTRWLTHVNAC